MRSSQISVQTIGFYRFDASQTTFYGLPYQKVNKVPLNRFEDPTYPRFQERYFTLILVSFRPLAGKVIEGRRGPHR